MAPSALGEPSLAAFKHLLGDQRRGHRRRPAGVECEMGNDLAQFALFASARDQVRDIVPGLVDLSERVLFGEVWERTGLSKRDRSLAPPQLLESYFQLRPVFHLVLLFLGRA
jgi:hypothetical protein